MWTRVRLVEGGSEAARAVSAAGENMSRVRPEGKRCCFSGERTWWPLSKQSLTRLDFAGVCSVAVALELSPMGHIVQQGVVTLPSADIFFSSS